MKKIFLWVVLASVACGSAFAADKKMDSKKSAMKAEVKADAKAANPMADEAHMKKVQELMTPNANHQVFENFVGKWNYVGKFWMAPDQPAQETVGVAEHRLIYGGRFMKEEIKGPWMGQEFEGIGYLGYDNVKGEYTSVWLDSMGTGIMTSTGSYNAATKTLSMEGKGSCPMTGEKERKGRSEWTVTDANHHTLTSYTNGPDGKEMKAMEIVYTRAE